MTQVAIVPALPEHVQPIATHCRPADAAEFKALSGMGPEYVLREGLRISSEVLTAVLDGEPVAMFGVATYSLLSQQGIPWMVGTTRLDSMTARKAVLRVARDTVRRWQREFPGMLFNVVDDRNEAAKRWLVWLGFELCEPQALGIEGRDFRPFYWSASNV